MKRAIVCVTNDLATDQRVHKTCIALQKSGFQVLEVGRILPDSLPLERPYHTKRLHLFFRKSALFYAEYNIRLFLFLLFSDVSLIVANDLDTLPAAWLAKNIKRCDLVYDSHEYYTETPELVNRKFVQSFWRNIEKGIFPKLKDVITVNKSIAQIYEKEYGIKLHVVRNIPPERNIISPATKAELGIPEDKKMILIQGAGINIQRGAEEAVEAMKYVNNAVLYIIGAGDVFRLLPWIIKDHNLQEKVFVLPKQSPGKLRQYTLLADLGLTVDKNTNLNYRYSLPNKLFDYIHSGVPVLASQLPEIERIITQYDIGTFIPDHKPESIAQTINNAFEDRPRYLRWKENLKVAASELSWEQEEKILLSIFARYA